MDQNSAIIGVFTLAVVGMLLRPLVVAWSRRISGAAANADLVNEVDELRGRVAELETERGRMAELEERLDFAERLLTTQGERLPLRAEKTPV